MIFTSGARIAEKRHNDAGWRSRLSKQMSLQPLLKRSVTGCSGRRGALLHWTTHVCTFNR